MLQLSLLLRLGQEAEQILMVEAKCQIIQIRSKRDGRLVAEEIRFTSCLVGDLRKIVLAPIQAPETAAKAARTAGIESVNDDVAALSLLDSGIHIRIDKSSAAELVDPIRDHQDFAANWAFRPAFDQVFDRQVDTGEGASVPERKAELAGRQGVIRGQVLHDVDRGVPHVADTNGRGGRLCDHEFTKIFELRAESGARSIVEQNKELQTAAFSLERDPIGHLGALVSLIDLYILTLQRRDLSAAARFHRDHSTRRDYSWRAGLT